jgi:hypothetical protein
MPFPATKIDMLEEGYTFAGMKVCPCGASMELWNTPRGAVMPMNPMRDLYDPAVVHWATCEKAEQFRRKKPDAKP